MYNVKTSHIPPPNGRREVIKRNFNTEDIVNTLLAEDKKFYDPQLCKWARDNFSPDRAGLQKLWAFMRWRVHYVADSPKKQEIKLPPALWKVKQGDCKSKTIFINAVLRCLKIPYIIKFTTNQQGSKLVKHVYTIAILNGKPIIMDSVYPHFDREPPYKYKREFSMEGTELALVSGNYTPYNGINYPLAKVASKGFNIPPPPQMVPGAMKKLKEIKQKQAYVPKFQPIPFHQLTEGQAALKIAERNLITLGIMQPRCKALADKGLAMVRQSMERLHHTGGSVIVGDVPKELYTLAFKIQQAAQNVAPAMVLRRPGRYNPPPHRVGITMPYGGLTIKQNEIFANNASGSAAFRFGINTPYEKSVGQMTIPTGEAIKEMVARYPQFYTSTPQLAYYYQNFAAVAPNQAFTELYNYGFPLEDALKKSEFQDILKVRSGVLSQYLNEIMQNKSTGSLGSAALYNWCDKFSLAGGPNQTLNDYPNAVAAKALQQQDLLGAYNFFTGVSQANINGMARNNILYDSGQDPVQMLAECIRFSNPGIGGGITAIVTAIVGIITALAGAASTIVDSVNKANALDSNAAQEIKPPRQNSPYTPSEQDWPLPVTTNVPGGSGNGGNGTTGSGAAPQGGFNFLQLAGIVAVAYGGYQLMQE